MISIYSYIPDTTNNFNFINSFCSFGKDVVFTVSDKLLYEKIKSFNYSNLQIEYISYTNLSEAYNSALLLTKNPIKICLEPKEYIDIQYKILWYDLASLLINDKVESYAIPLFNSNMEYITSKWFIHKDGCIRGKPIDTPETYDKYSNGMDLISTDTKDIVSFKATPIHLNEQTMKQFPFVLQY